MDILIVDNGMGFQYAKDHISTASDPAQIYYAMYDEGLIVGIVGTKHRWQNVHELCHLYVSREYRGRGNGSKLIQHAVKDTPNTHMCATTVCDNDKAVRLFMRNGWVLRVKERSRHSERMLYTFTHDTWKEELDESKPI